MTMIGFPSYESSIGLASATVPGVNRRIIERRIAILISRPYMVAFYDYS
jgi:hypothetical protein